jgi:iron-sulfur cluster assembly accessory protein
MPHRLSFCAWAYAMGDVPVSDDKSKRTREIDDLMEYALWCYIIHSLDEITNICLLFSGLSYVMDFSTSDDIQEEDEVDTYDQEGIQCVVDAKSLLYLYGLELDYSDDLIGGGFKFFNPNAEESCGCGSSFGV